MRLRPDRLTGKNLFAYQGFLFFGGFTMKNYVVLIDKINKIIKYILLIFMVILVASVTLQVLSRLPFMNFKTSMLEEISRFMMISVAYFAGALLVRGKEYKLTCVDALPEMLHGTAKKIIIEIAQILSLIFLLIVIWASTKFIQLGMMQTAPGTGIKMWVIYMVIPAGSVFMLLNWFAASFERWGIVTND